MIDSALQRAYHCSMRFQDAAFEFLQWRKVNGFSPNTIRNDKSALLAAYTILGDIELELIDHDRMQRVFSMMEKTCVASTINTRHASYSAFWKWARITKKVTPDHDPMAGIRLRRVAKRNFTRLEVGEFMPFLDAAPTPRHRAMAALGLFLFLRAGEITSLRVRDLRLGEGTIDVTVHKTKDVDTMPIPRELDRELRAWLTVYTEECGNLRPDWFLIPARRNAGFGVHELNPTRPVSRPQELLQGHLEAYGLDVKGEAFHLLRRSGCRALFDELTESGIDGALEICKTQLHHASVVMTERYLGITHSRAKRDLLLKGNDMFPSLAGDNVVRLRSAQ